MGKEKKVVTKWLYWFTFAVAVITVYKTLDNFSEITSWIGGLINVLYPFIVALIISYLFYIPCRGVENKLRKLGIKKKARGLAILIVYSIAIICCVLLVKFVVPAASETIMELISSLPAYYNTAINTINQLPADSILNKIDAVEFINGLGQIDWAQYLNIENLGQYIKGALGVATTLFDVFVTIIVSIYLLAERGNILNFARKFCRAMFKRDTYKEIAKNFRRSNDVFFKFLSSQILDALIMGTVASIAMSILQVKYAVLLGFMIGLFNLIPYLGAVIAVVIAVVITALTGGITQAIWTAIVVIILQQIDANIINPRITGTNLNISPILVIFSVTLFGAYFGVIGMFLAVPIVTVIKLWLEDYMDLKIENKLAK